MRFLAHTLRTTVLLVVTLNLVGCDADFLNLQPESELTSATFWTTQDDAVLALGLAPDDQQALLECLSDVRRRRASRSVSDVSQTVADA